MDTMHGLNVTPTPSGADLWCDCGEWSHEVVLSYRPGAWAQARDAWIGHVGDTDDAAEAWSAQVSGDVDEE